MGEAADQGRAISIAVVDEAGRPAFAATLRIFVDGVYAGELRNTRNGRVMLTEAGVLDLTARLGLATATVRLEAGQDEARIVLPALRTIEAVGQPTARCADGRSGQPCVTCTVKGRSVVICA